jgi:hypothetical protein
LSFWLEMTGKLGRLAVIEGPGASPISLKINANL